MSAPLPDAYEAVRHRAGLIGREDRGRLVVSGPDRASYLQGLLTNDIVALRAGEGCYTAYLTAQGRMIADLLAYELGDVILATMSRDVTGAVLARLNQFIFAEDVALGDVTETFEQFAVVGPAAAAAIAPMLADVTAAALAALPVHGNVRASYLDQPVIVARSDDTGERGFDLFVERRHGRALREALLAAGVSAVDPATAAAVRIEAGVPVFHRDMDEETIPLEAGIESRAISLTKGCYVGQEVIIRVLHRGHGRVARRLVGLTMDGLSTPPSGSEVKSGDRVIGRVTSAALSPALERPIALAYLQRDFVDPGTAVTVEDARATVTALPFVRS